MDVRLLCSLVCRLQHMLAIDSKVSVDLTILETRLRAASAGMAGYGKATGLDVLVKDGCGLRGPSRRVYHVPSCTTHPVAHKNPSDLCMCID
ncbi:uncharacterized [Tachysurus ichikawai]